MGLQVDLYSIDATTHLAKVPRAAGVAIMEEHNGDGQLAFRVAASSLGAAAIVAAEDALVRVSMDGVPIGWGVLDGDGDEPGDPAGEARPLAVTAPGTASLLIDAIVREASPGMTQRNFVTLTPGDLMEQVLLEAQARGVLDGITHSFTAAEDSDGTPWPSVYTRTVEVGTTVRQVLADLVEQGLVDFRMVGLRLDMYVPDTVLGTDHPELILHPAWMTANERRRQRSGKVTSMLGLGDGGVTYEATVAGVGRKREALTQYGGIKDAGTLQIATEATLEPLAKGRQGYSLTYRTAPGRPTPWVDFLVGHRLRHAAIPAEVGEGLEPLRVRTMSVELQGSGVSAVTIELNDVFLEQEIVNKLRLDRLTNGSGISGTPADYGADLMPPAAPASVMVTSDVYDAGNGILAAQATASWPAVNTNEDGTVTTDVVGYELQWKIGAASYDTSGPIQRSSATTMSRDGLPLGVDLRARVRAVDRAGNGGEWMQSDLIVTATDDGPPPTPSNLVAESLLGLITVTWTGTATGGGAMPADLEAVELWQSTSVGFNIGDPGSSMVEQWRPRGGTAVVTGTDYLVPMYFRARARDRSGLYSAATPEVTGMRQMIGDGDVQVITGAVIGDATIGSAKIISLAATKLTAGSLVAEIGITTGELVAGNPFGNHLVLDAAGLRMYAAGVATVDMNVSSGVATLQGVTVKTAASGDRVEVLQSGGAGRVRFIEGAYTIELVGDASAGRLTSSHPLSAPSLWTDSVLFNEGGTFKGGIYSDSNGLDYQASGGWHDFSVGQARFAAGIRVGGAADLYAVGMGEESDTTDANARVTVSHFLGGTPVAVAVTGRSGAGRSYDVFSKGASTFVVQVRDAAGANLAATPVEFGWIACR